MRSDRNRLQPIIAALLIVAAFLPRAGHAQVTSAITPDGTLGTTVARSGNLFDINGGRIIGGVNQFHSFGQFSVGTGDIASFNGPASIRNILSRVTGGNISQIDGTIRSTISGANLFLMNPSGILFGPNAQLDVSGSFHATTADFIGLADGARFNAVPSSADNLLTTAPPAAFGFLNSTGSIEVTSARRAIPSRLRPLQVPEGQTLSFVGGELNLGAADGSAPAYILAPGGTVNLVSVVSGTATLNGSRIDAGSSSTLGNVNLRGFSIVDGKNVYIRGGRFVVEDAAVIPGAFFLLGFATPPPDGGEIDVKVTGDVTFTGTTFDPLIGAPAGIFAFAGDFFGVPAVPAKVPDIKIEANAVNLSGVAGVLTNKAGPGTPANVVINANSVKIENGASVSLINLFEGPGDNLTVNARDVELVGNGGASFTGLLSQTFFHPFYDPAQLFGGSINPALTMANSGSITVNAAGNLIVRDGAQITTDSRSFGSSGNITLNVKDAFLSGREGGIAAQSAFAGNSGNVTINATGQIQINDGFVISSTTFGSGESGNVVVTAGQSINITGTASGIASQTAPLPDDEANAFASFFLGRDATLAELAGKLGLDPNTANILDVIGGLNNAGLTAVTDLTPGNGGSISVTAPLLALAGKDSAIDSSTAWGGNAGQINLNVGSLSVTEGAQIRSRSGLVDLVTGDLLLGAGNAGNITITGTGPNAIMISGQDSTISTTTFGDGNAGNISLSANHVNVQNGGSVTSASGGTVNGQLFVGAGNAGQISVSTPTLTMADGTISVATSGAGSAGSILLNGNTLSLTGGSQVVSSTTGSGQGGSVTATAGESIFISGSGSGLLSTASSTGNAGQITVSTPTLTMGESGTISVATSGAGNAGNISLNVSSFTQTGGAQVVSSTTGAGQGGNVTLSATESASFSGLGSGLLSTASSTGNAGEVIVSTPNLAMSNGAISVATSGAGNAGNVLLNVNNFSLTGGAQILSSTISEGQGGNVTLSAVDSISISGQGTGLFSTAASTGNAGQITVTAPALAPVPTLTMADGGTISVATSGAGSAGSILLNANNFSLTGGSQVVSSTSGAGQGGSVTANASQSASISGQDTGLFSTTSGSGNAGQINVSTPTLTMGDGGTISVATSGAGNAGNVLLNANNFSLTGGAQIVSSTGGAGQGGSVSANATESALISGQDTGLFNTASGTGNAGQINVSTPTLNMGDGGTISVATSGAGNAGNIALNVTNFTQTGGARVDSSTTGGGLGGDLTVTAANSASMSGSGTGLFSTASSTGAGGDIKIQGGQLVQLTNNATVSAQSTGAATATAGNITINAPTFEAQNGSVTTGATLADGGNISITTTGSLVRLTDSQITTSVQSGVGSGGNIAIDSQLIVLDNSQVLANAFGGPGGNINITADVFLVNSGGQFPTSLAGIVDASSALSTPGTINIEATFTNVTGTFAQLPGTPLQATELLRASCAARFAGGKASSLVLGGRDGLPLQPGDLLPSPLYVASDADTPSTGTKVTGYDQSLRFSLLGSKDRLLSQYSLLRNVKCSL